MKYETVIIGAGMSGLAAGIRLAYYDRPVCILERHTTIGGLNSFYRLRGRNYDVGLHAVTNYAAPGARSGPLAKILKQLRLRWDDFDLSPQCGSSVSFPGRRLHFTNDLEILRESVRAEFPDQIAAFDQLIACVEGYDEFDLEQPVRSAREVVGEFLTDPLFVDMLFCPLLFYSSPTPNDMEFGQFVIMFKSIFKEGFARPHEGVRRILKTLTRHYRALGGDLKLRHGVKEIKIENGRATGVILDDGQEIEAEYVLSSAGSAETARLCGNAVSSSPAPQPGQISFNEAIFALDCSPSSLGLNDTIVFYNNTETFRYETPETPVDLRSGIICCPSNFQYTQPEDPENNLVRITALANPWYWMDQPEPDYVAAKQSTCEEIVNAALRHIPDFRSHVLDEDVFTPRTVKKYTGHLNGAVYGAPSKNWEGITDVPNVFLCGTDQGFLGIVGAMLSGISMANRHLLQ